MKCDEYDSLTFGLTLRDAPYSSSLATSASASSASVWSDTSSQSSDDSAASAPTSDSDSCGSSCPDYPSQTSESACKQAIRLFDPWSKQPAQIPPQPHFEAVAPELRLNPRRSSTSSTTRSGCPPPIVRQTDRKVNFVDNLVDSSTQIVEAIWPTSSVVCRNETGNNSVLPLRTFIQETLRRSRTSYSTLQVALYYLILIKAHVPEHDFTMEQPVDCHASRALQCGRRMFLAALILASKYLQDRNYSARAWSRISGLATQEINQNEMAFLAAVNWKLHITEEVYHRWTDCVMKFKPPQPPSPGSPCQGQFDRQCEEFRAIVLKLSPELENVDDLAPCSPTGSRSRDFPVVSPKWLTAASERSPGFGGFDTVSYGTPSVMEPTPTPAHTPGRLAPALGLLPTPRLTPQTGGFSTPAVSAVPFLLGRASSMGYAMAQASGVSAAQGLDRWPGSSSSSPLAFGLTRRSSLATSVSAASSPDSMVSDSSRISRSSSISSASSLASAPYAKLDVLARCRSAKQCGERFNLRPAIASVPEDYTPCLTSSPEAYSGPVGKDLCDLSLETPLGRREREMDEAARALQELQNHCAVPAPATQRPSLKRSRTFSTDHSLQDNVREMLGGRLPSQATWPDALVRPRPGLQVPVASTLGGGRKRVCCSNEAMDSYGNAALLHPSMNGLAGPGMWEGIL